MTAVTDSLSRLENEHQETLDELHRLRKKTVLDPGDLDILDDIEEIVQDWDQIFGGDIATDTIGRKVEDVRKSSEPHQLVKDLDLLVDPLRHYVIGLEKYKVEEWRETVTRCAMVVERIVTEIAIELDSEDEIEGMKMEDSFGLLQNQLEARGVHRAREFIANMRNIYSIRDDRGPHDVPAAEMFQAKHAISNLMYTYYRYLQIISEIGGSKLPDADIRDFTNLLDLILEFNPRMIMGEGGGEPSLKEILVQDLYKSGFFETGRTLSEVEEELQSKRHNPPKSTLSSNLKRLTGKILTRKGSRGNYRYVEKLPPEDYFN